ncbi:MAG: hypothetical protein NC299_09850 [Lachnospiraceae bacterium]|nr:hypothetical protein [Ruminococcus sp.]MCM1275656.1 hypothetical protein [Lachnospiraceae bacterium]
MESFVLLGTVTGSAEVAVDELNGTLSEDDDGSDIGSEDDETAGGSLEDDCSLEEELSGGSTVVLDDVLSSDDTGSAVLSEFTVLSGFSELVELVLDDTSDCELVSPPDTVEVLIELPLSLLISVDVSPL